MPASGIIDHRGFGAKLAPGERLIAAYATQASGSLGREHDEPECATRSPFQRDRDRIIHSTAFRRLTYKTQVFLFHEGDHYRSRLTHSLEVAQIARTIARQLCLDEDLAEAIALAHDLGHSPFGHAGERALDRAMHGAGGFDHNAQSLRVVIRLERKYLTFDGLNLTWETLEGLAKHNGPVADAGSPVAKIMGDVKSGDAEKRSPPGLDTWASAEAQVASLADDIAYVTHDVDDGLRAGLLTWDALGAAPLLGPIVREVRGIATNAGENRAVYELTRRMITLMIADVVAESRARLADLQPMSANCVRSAGRATVVFAKPMAEAVAALKAFLFAAVYHHPRVLSVMQGAEKIVDDLFGRYCDLNDEDAMPDAWASLMKSVGDRGRARIVCDYLAGQTDRYAIAEHRRLFDATPDLR